MVAVFVQVNENINGLTDNKIVTYSCNSIFSRPQQIVKNSKMRLIILTQILNLLTLPTYFRRPFSISFRSPYFQLFLEIPKRALIFSHEQIQAAMDNHPHPTAFALSYYHVHCIAASDWSCHSTPAELVHKKCKISLRSRELLCQALVSHKHALLLAWVH